MKGKRNLNKMVMKNIKLAIQVINFLLLPALFIEIFYAIKTIMNLLLRQQGSLQSAFFSIIILSGATILTFVSGRFFCGWMCAFGSMQDFVFFLSHRFIKNTKNFPKIDRQLKWIKYVIGFVIIVLLWGAEIITIPSGWNPWDLFGMLTSLQSWLTIGSILNGFGVAALLLFLILVFSAISERFFCKYFCPLGAYFSILSRFRWMTIKKRRENCGSCTLCTVKCKMSIPLYKMDQVHTGECINCMKCEMVCPKTNVSLEFSGQKRNAVAVGTVSCAVLAGAYYLGSFYDAHAGMNTESTIIASETAATESQASIAAGMEDGTYTGSGEGFKGTTTVQVTVQDEMITEIEIVSSSDDKQYLNKAANGIISEILESQSIEVDTVSGATYSSKGIIAAVADAMDENTAYEAETEATVESVEAEDGSTVQNDSSSESFDSLEDGTYSGSGTGLRGETDVTVTIENGAITDVTIDSYEDDREYFERAEETIIEEIIAEQSVDVDAVSGATYSSNSIKEAVADALGMSYTASPVQENNGRGKGGSKTENSIHD